MERRTSTGKVLLALAGAVGAALVVFVLAPWLQSSPPSPSSPDETMQEVLLLPGKGDGDAPNEADVASGVIPEGEGGKMVSAPPGPVAPPVEVAGAHQEAVGELPAPLTADQVAAAMLDPAGHDEGGEDEGSMGQAADSAVNEFAAAVLKRLDDMVDAAAAPSDAVLVASAPSVDEDEDETAGPERVPVDEPVPPEAATAVETVEGEAEPPPEDCGHAPPVETVVTERDMRIEFSRPAEEVAAVAAGPPSGALVQPSVLPAAGLSQLQRAEAVTGLHVPRGVMGYRMPLVSRQVSPIQVVSGVVMPAHHSYVILRPGHWELLTEDGGIVVPAQPVTEEPSPPRSRWRFLDLFRRRTPAGEE